MGFRSYVRHFGCNFGASSSFTAIGFFSIRVLSFEQQQQQEEIVAKIYYTPFEQKEQQEQKQQQQKEEKVAQIIVFYGFQKLR